jgi:hypothetical protein
MTWEPCVTCTRLRKCGVVDHSLLLEGGGCSLHEVVHEGVVCARLRIMDEFGAQAIPTKSNLKKGIIVMAGKVSKTAANKRNLRALGKTLGVISRGGASFKLTAEEICQMIMDSGDDRFASLDEMDDEEVSALTKAVASGDAPAAPAEKEKTAAVEEGEPQEEKPAPKKRTRRARKPKAETPPPDESGEDAPEEEPAAKPTPSKRKAPAGRRRPGRKAPAAKAESSTAGVSADLSKLEEMVKVIGVAGDDRDKAIKTIGKALEVLAEKIDAIDGFLCYEYNQEQGEGNEIGSLTEVDWT